MPDAASDDDGDEVSNLDELFIGSDLCSPLGDVYDVLVHPGSKAAGLIHCIARLDHNGVTNAVEARTQCLWDAPTGDPDSAVPAQGPDLLPGPPPPPPYSETPVTNLNGAYDSGTDTLTLTGCFANIGGTLGPNLNVSLTVPGAEAQLAGGPPKNTIGAMEGSLLLYPNQSIALCDAASPQGTPQGPLPINLLKAGTDGQASWRTNALDFDGEGCYDFDELGGELSPFRCGDDPYNSLDSPLETSADGPYSILATLARADRDTVEDTGGDAGGANSCYDGMDNGGGDGADQLDVNDCQVIPGIYLNCIADVQHNETTNALSEPIYCYADSPIIAVNPEAYPGLAGDGVPGGAPPTKDNTSIGGNQDLYGDVDSNHTVLTGALDNLNNKLHTEGCFVNKDGQNPLGNVYLRATIEEYTGTGTADVYIAQPINCSPPPTGSCVPIPALCGVMIQAARQPAGWDTDLDGCTDRQELRQNQAQGGLRDPFNRWDIFDTPAAPNNYDRSINVGDIIRVVQRFGANDAMGAALINRHTDPRSAPPSAPAYHPAFDREGLTGSSAWNLRPPNGAITVSDILGTVRQFGHNCLV